VVGALAGDITLRSHAQTHSTQNFPKAEAGADGRYAQLGAATTGAYGYAAIVHPRSRHPLRQQPGYWLPRHLNSFLGYQVARYAGHNEKEPFTYALTWA
jgi:hypothetical protein